MADVLRFQPGVIDNVGPQAVYFKSRWQDPWQLFPEAWCSEATWAVNPTLPTAQIRYRYGSGLHRLLNQFQFWPRVTNKLRQYVRIDWILNFINPDDESPLERRWYGVLDIELDDLHGPLLGQDDDGNPTAYASGVNHWTAYGLESLLDTVECTTSVIQGEEAEDVFLVERAIPFNPGVPGTLRRRGNRGSVADGDGVYRFHNRTTAGSDWSTRECVKYLLQHDAPKDYSGERSLPFALFDPQGICPTWDDPQLPRQDRTVRELLNSLLARQRLLGYRTFVVEPDEGNGGTIFVVPVSFSGQDLSLGAVVLPSGSSGGEAVFKANPNQKILAIEQDRGATASLKRTAADQFDQVLARGAQRTSTGTFSYVDSTLAIGWTPDQETAFEAGASGDPNYPAAAEIAARAWANFRAREVDRLKRVYARHILPPDFPGYVGDGESGDAGYVLQPSDANLEAPTPIAPDDRRFLTEIPLLADHDYSGDMVGSAAGAQEEGDGPHLHLRPLVLFRRIDWTEEAKRYRHAEKESIDLELTVGAQNSDPWSARVHVDHQDGALWIEVANGVQQMIAKTDFTRLAVVDPAVHADFRFLLATLAVGWSQYAEARYPTELAPQGIDGIRRMTLLLGNDYRADFVAPQTVVGLSAGGELIRSNGGYVRDDRPKLAAIAKLAWQWYGRFRQALTFQTSLVSNALEVGDYVVSIGDPLIPGDVHDDVGSVVTQLRLSMPLAEGENNLSVLAPTMHYTTAFGELDALQFRRTL